MNIKKKKKMQKQVKLLGISGQALHFSVPHICMHKHMFLFLFVCLKVGKGKMRNYTKIKNKGGKTFLRTVENWSN